MHPRYRLLLPLLCLAVPSLALAKPKKKAAAPKDTFYVLIGPGGSAEEAQAGLKKLAAADLSFVQLTQGYPQVIGSDSVVGLKPGFQVVVFGFCKDAGRANQLAKAFQAASPGTYVRKVSGPYDGRCPSLQGERWLLSTSTEACEDKARVTSTRVEVVRNGKSVVKDSFPGDCKDLHSRTAEEVVFGGRTMLLVTDSHKAWRTSASDDFHPELQDEETYELWSLEGGVLKRVLSLPLADSSPQFESYDDWKQLKFSQQGWSGTRSYEYTWNPTKAAYVDSTPPDQAEANSAMDSEGD